MRMAETDKERYRRREGPAEKETGKERNTDGEHTVPRIKKSWMKPSQVVTMIFDDPKVWFDFSHLQKFIQMGKF